MYDQYVIIMKTFDIFMDAKNYFQGVLMEWFCFSVVLHKIINIIRKDLQFF